MPTEIQDILTAASINEQSGRVKRAVRHFLITGLVTPMDTADPSYDGPAGRIKEAAGVLTVNQGDRHPTYDFLYCKERTATIVDTDKVRFELVYDQVDFPSFLPGPQEAPETANAVEDGYVASGRVFLEQEETFVDKDGDPIELSFTGYPTISVSVPVKRHRRTLVLEKSLLTTDPGSFGDTYVGKVNSGTWQGGAAGTWMCEDVSFDQVAREVKDGPATTPLYRLRFVFAYNPNGWDPDVVYTDPETGNPIAGWDGDANASATVALYDAANFGNIP